MSVRRARGGSHTASGLVYRRACVFPIDRTIRGLRSISTSRESTEPATEPPAKFVGAHISASGGCLRALANAQEHLGPRARSFAFFVRPRLSWKSAPPIDDATVLAFRQQLATSQFDASHVVVHGSYIANLGSHDAELRRKSVELMVEEVRRCAQLGVPWYVFHPGSCTRVPEEEQWAYPVKKKKSRRKDGDKKEEEEQQQQCVSEMMEEAREKEAVARRKSLRFIAEGMAEVLSLTDNVTLCVENMCGQGNVLGRDFEELRSILDGVMAVRSDTKNRLGVCLDTCHAHASGIALRSAEDGEKMMEDFYQTMGDEWKNALKVLHVNDSMDTCGSRKDRHENIGLGRIGLAAFDWVMNSPRFDNMPMILETPRRGEDGWNERVERVEDDAQRDLLRKFMEKDSDANEIELLLQLIRQPRA